MNKIIIQELQEIKKLLQVIVSNEEQKPSELEISSLKFWFNYWKNYIPIFILGFVAGCTLYPLGIELWRWLIA